MTPTTERELIADLNEDLLEAWEKLKEFSLGLGEQRVYASGRSIMFSKKICFFFVRPRKSYPEVVIFLPGKKKRPGFKSVQAASKTKFAHTFKLIHADQIGGELIEALTEAYRWK